MIKFRRQLYTPTPDEVEILARAADPADGIGANWALRYFFDREFRKWGFL